MKQANLNICHIYATFLPVTSGGVEHYIINVSRYMASLGHQCLLITPKYRHRLHTLPNTNDLGFLRIFRVGLFSPPYARRRFIGPFLNRALYKYNALLGARVERRKIDSELIHIHSGYFSLELGFRLSKWLNRPFIITVHERFSNITDVCRHIRIFEVAEKIVVHRTFNQSLLEKCKLGHKTIFMPMFIDVEKYKRHHDFDLVNDGIIRILYVGRLEKRRDPSSLIHAFSNVDKQCPDVELHMVGDGPLKKEVNLLIKRYGLGKKVFLHGEQLDIRKNLWQSDIYVSTNTVDDYPSLALREAMSAGLAIIDTDVGEIKKLICRGKNGLLIPPSDSTALSKSIITLIEDEKFRKRLGANALISSQEFDIVTCIQRLLEIYNEGSGR